MPEVKVKINEPIFLALRRLKKLCDFESFSKVLKNRKRFVKPSKKKREKSKQAFKYKKIKIRRDF